MQPQNLLFIISDEHQRNANGCYGHPLVQTPNIDRLAQRGTRFTNAYTNCPICVPARAILASGYYAHQTGHWDNAFPYFGEPTGWGHQLKKAGYHVDSIGKLHYRSNDDDNGFTNEIDAMYVAEGIGEIISCLREKTPDRKGRGGIVNAKPGDSDYLQYDRRTTQNACDWLTDHANDEKPWAAFVSLVCPHPPFIAPEEFYNLYSHDQIQLPTHWRVEDWPHHPALDYFRQHFGWQEPIDEANLRKVIATYYALCTFVDQNIGRILHTLDEQNLTENTRIIYTSDHGAMMGAQGLFGKFQMYDNAAAIPFIMAGPDIPQNKTVNTPISLVDCHPTICEAFGLTTESDIRPGQSLFEIANGADKHRFVFSEYHAAGTKNGIYMLTDGQHKYIHYTHDVGQFFDLKNDPDERSDLFTSPEHQQIIGEFQRELYTILNPETTDAKAKSDQWAKVEAFGGEEAVIKRGLSNSPVPGKAPVFHYFK